MKILVVSQHYYPEQFRITEICEELVRNGNQYLLVYQIIQKEKYMPDMKIYDVKR